MSLAMENAAGRWNLGINGAQTQMSELNTF